MYKTIRVFLLLLGIFLMIPNISNAKNNMLTPYHMMTTSDHRSIRYGIWHTRKEKKQGSVILLNGRREFMEKYLETIGELNDKGFDVYSLDWRGQGLSTRILSNRQKGFIESYDIYLNDLQQFVSDIVKPQAVDPLIILGHSMGGHIALRFIHDHPGIVEKAVLTAPMIDIFKSPLSRWFVSFISWAATSAGFSHSYTIGSGDYTDKDEKFEGNILTSDPERFKDTCKIIAKNPDLALGGVTYGWLSATLKSTQILTDPGYAKKIETPVLIISAGDDEVVSDRAQKNFCAMMPNCRLVVIPGSRHEILRETDAVRSMFWDEFDRFSKADIPTQKE